MNCHSVIDFWFKEITPADWWLKDEKLDADIARRFGVLHRQASLGELYSWREKPLGRLAEVIVLDQFSRNIYRDKAQSFVCDGMALALAQEAIAQGTDKYLAPEQKLFLYLPYMHSESLLIHEQAVQLFKQPGLEQNLDFENKHKAIIERYGRYPHRNVILGRESTPDEQSFLQQPGSEF